ncbi:MAG TPA: ThuA domain-containing protein [Burkholderiales bacterium]|nr:ThuA domain-containing protein [Burkholderiales bacterium]
MPLPRVTVFSEDTPQPQPEAYARAYPRGIHQSLAAPLRARGLAVRDALWSQPEHGLSDDVLAQTDVLVYWEHIAAQKTDEDVVTRLHRRVLGGMGLVALHSAAVSKLLRRLLGTSAGFRYRNIGERERVWVIDPAHPIAQGVPRYIELEGEEMYGEPFDVPPPDELVLTSWFEGGEVFRSGCCWRRGRGKVFYFRPGHETTPTYDNADVQRLLYNAVLWAAPQEPPSPVPERAINDKDNILEQGMVRRLKEGR